MAGTKDNPLLSDRIEVVKKELESLTLSTKGDEEARKSLLAVSQQTTNALQSAHEAIWRFIYEVRKYTSRARVHPFMKRKS